jgi:phage tail sheath protein FI
MPTTYLSPGVYVEEVDSGPQPIQGVSTSITGAVGVTAFGPTTGKPVLVTSFAEFTRNFGGFLPDPPSAIYNRWALDKNEGGEWWRFPLTVKGFFDNGGQQLFVKRVFASTAVASSGSLGQGLVADVTSDAPSGATTVQLSHLINVYETVTIKFFRGDTGLQIGGNFTVSAYNATTGQVTVAPALPAALVSGRGDFASIHDIVAPGANTTLTFSANAYGDWGNALSVEVLPMVGNTLTILGNPNIANNGPATTTVLSTTNAAGPPATTTVAVASVAGFANGDRILVSGQEYVIANVTAAAAGPPPTPASFTITPALGAGVSWAAGTAVKRLRVANAAGVATINARGASSALYKSAIVELDTGHTKETFTVLSIAGDTVTLSANLVNVYFEGYKLRLVEAQVNVNYAPAGGTPASESFGNLRLVNDGTINYLVNFVNQQSKFVTVVKGPGFSWSSLAAFPTAQSGGWQTLSLGDDHLADLTVEDFVGVDGGSGARTGIQALEDITEISICIVPGMWSTTVQSALITHCEALRYRFAIVDPPDNLGIEDVIAFRAPLDTKYGALYYPWVEVLDPSTVQNVDVPPSGHMAGIYAQTDNDRGVFKAPANVVISMITKISQDVNKREQELLNPIGINALRFFPERGNRVWGARTLSSESAWKYINVRRLFIYVEASIDYGTQWVVFEPNDQTLWARVRQTIGDFLDTTWRSGALQGATASQAYFVKCDMTTMTQDDIDNGRLICVIGIAPVKPAEFVIFRIQQFTQTTAS